MTEETYNGWSNRETWAVKLHLDNTESSHLWLMHAARSTRAMAEQIEQVKSGVWSKEQAEVFNLADKLKEAVELTFERALNPSDVRRGEFFDRFCGEAVDLIDPRDVLRMIGDVGSLWRVDWREIARNVLSGL